jgi:Transposase DDE domain
VHSGYAGRSSANGQEGLKGSDGNVLMAFSVDAYVTSRRERKKVEMLFAHLKRILKLDRLRLRGPCGARDEFHLAATAQNLRKLAKLIPPAAPAIA